MARISKWLLRWCVTFHFARVCVDGGSSIVPILQYMCVMCNRRLYKRPRDNNNSGHFHSAFYRIISPTWMSTPHFTRSAIMHNVYIETSKIIYSDNVFPLTCMNTHTQKECNKAKGWGRVNRGVNKTYFEITCGIICRGEFLTQFLRHERTEYDGCQKGVNSIAFPTSYDL